MRPLSLIIALMLLAVAAVSAQVQEWPLLDPTLQQRTTLALQRYFSVVKPDSVRLRYLLQNAGAIHYQIRGRRTSEDTLGQLLSISLGQLSVYTWTNLRIAFGDDLYAELALSRNDPEARAELREIGGEFGLDSWQSDRSLMIALDRIDYRINHDLGVFIAVGAPESNLFWWSDGTFRVGLEGADWELAALFPYGAGATEFGFLHERLLSPGYGAAARARLGNLSGRISFTLPGESAFASLLVAPRRFVHTASGALAWHGSVDTRYGIFGYTVGGGYEEFAAVGRDSSEAVVQQGRVRRIGPIAELAWTAPGDNVRLSMGTTDIALRAGLSAQLTERLSIELRYVVNDLFRPIKSFEHPTAFFLTPKVMF